MGGKVCRSAHGTVHHVVQDEDSRRLANALHRHWIERPPFYQQETEHGAVESEDSARGACANGHRMDPHADHAACEACDEVDEQVAHASENGFDERPDQVEHVHVHADVDDAEVQKAGGEETPPLVCAYGRGAEVAAPLEYIERRGLGEGDAACHHGQEDQNVDYDQSDRDGVRTARTGRGGFLGEGFGDGSVVHVSTVLALCRWWRDPFLGCRSDPIPSQSHVRLTQSANRNQVERQQQPVPAAAKTKDAIKDNDKSPLTQNHLLIETRLRGSLAELIAECRVGLPAQAGYKIQPLHEFTHTAVPPARPAPGWPKPITAAQQTSLDFFGQMAFLLQFCVPPHPSETELSQSFKRIGIEPGKPFNPSSFSPEIQNALKAGIDDGQKAIDASRAATGGKTETFFGSHEYLKNNFLARTTGTVMGIGY